MRILIVSDTHGRHAALDRALEEAGQIDAFIHLGDVEGGEDYVNAVVDCEKHIVRGNNDFFSDLPREEEFYLGNTKSLSLTGMLIMYRLTRSILWKKVVPGKRIL